MLKTNSKKVKEFFKNYVKEGLDIDELNSCIDAFNDLAMSDYGFSYTSLTDFMINNYGGVGVLTCWYSEMREILKKALEETDQEANKYDNDQVANLYCVLCDRALIDVYRLDKAIKFNKYRKCVFTWEVKQ